MKKGINELIKAIIFGYITFSIAGILAIAPWQNGAMYGIIAWTFMIIIVPAVRFRNAIFKKINNYFKLFGF